MWYGDAMMCGVSCSAGVVIGVLGIITVTFANVVGYVHGYENISVVWVVRMTGVAHVFPIVVMSSCAGLLCSCMVLRCMAVDVAM